MGRGKSTALISFTPKLQKPGNAVTDRGSSMALLWSIMVSLCKLRVVFKQATVADEGGKNKRVKAK